MRILYNPLFSEYKTPFGVLRPNEDCTLHIRIPCSCQTVSAELVLLDECYAEAFSFPFGLETKDGDYDTWECTFRIHETGLYFYRFQITTQNESFRLFRQGTDTNMEVGDLWQISVVENTSVPEFYSGAVMYQIFPDRFYREGDCDCTEKLQPYWMHTDLTDIPAYAPDENGKILNNDFYGGNLKGIVCKLPYLHWLGVEVLYLNPIFMAWSNHRYDTYDYHRIDPMLGTEQDFAFLCHAAHELGMRVILDGVFSHVGDRSPYFQDAIHHPDSAYADWFTFRHFPDDYETWWGILTLPRVNKHSERFMQEIFDADDSVVAHWLRLGADGFRLDVADELPEAFLDRLRQRIRRIKPEAIVIGEVWEDASNKISYDKRCHYFTKNELDSVMNYPWKDAILHFVRREDDGQSLGNIVWQLAENYPPEVLSRLMNILSTHDTVRALQALADPTERSREEEAAFHMSHEQYVLGASRLKMAAFLQFTLPGMACIYYGDEAGMTGGKDPFNRRFYPWGQENTELISFYRSLSRLKRTCLPLQKGDIRVLEAGGGHFRFARTYHGQTVEVLCNCADADWPLSSAASLLFARNISVSPEGRKLIPGGFALLEV